MINLFEIWHNVVPVLGGLLAICILCLCISWQARTFRRDLDHGYRRIKAILISVVLICVCAGAWLVLEVIDRPETMTIVRRIEYLVAVLILAFVFIVKTWVGPLLVGATLSWFVYMLLAHHTIRLIPLFELIYKAIGASLPQGSEVAFVIFTLVVAAVSPIFDDLYERLRG